MSVSSFSATSTSAYETNFRFNELEDGRAGERDRLEECGRSSMILRGGFER